MVIRRTAARTRDGSRASVEAVLEQLIALLVPPRCLACGGPAAGAGDVLCSPCRRALPWLRDPCPRCALPRPCARRCPAAGQRFDAAWAPVAHAGPARDLVVALKFRGALAAADTMAAQMAACIPRLAALQVTAVVPVPPDPRRRRRRGFDPADLLARRIAGRLDRPLVRCLQRRGPPSRQLGSARAERLRAPGELDAAPGPPRAVLLVDDVHTTGATLDACARALTSGGSRTVSAVTYARTLRRP